MTAPPSPAPTPSRAGRLVRRLPLPSEATLRRLAVASLVTQTGIIVTGGAVRLTDSGLGCPDWPHCTAGSLTSTPEMGMHGAIEFGNRLLTFVLGAVALAMLVAVIRTFGSDRPRRDLLVPAAFLLGFIPAQAVIGGITVWSDLNPWVVMFHFLVSTVLVGVATILVRRAQRPRGAVPQRVGQPWLERLGLLVLAATAVSVYLGAVVTGSGPHAGDPDAKRTGLDVAVVTQIHADAVLVLVGLSVGLYFAARIAGSPGRSARAAVVLLVVEAAQGVIGFVQYRLELPELLVGLHMLGAGLMVMAAVDAWQATRWLPAAEHPAAMEHPAEAPGEPAPAGQRIP
ncbi:COX15/CtaA family protein [Jiangella gansuensis]|uniref:COX15/CtaA family protein n=1 Tax=Jiangella gansuensis TaxID=281473 RepID=UPI0012F96FF1|nr:COX15/CtaA family protein [Jiangella gansuensis]